MSKCTLNDKELVEKCSDWISKLCRSKGNDWCLSIPVNSNEDPDELLSEMIKRFEEVTTWKSELIANRNCEDCCNYGTVYCNYCDDDEKDNFGRCF